MEEDQMLQQILAISEGFGARCRKFTGAVTVEVFRAFLIRHGFAVSLRDVFIRGVPVEIDLLLPAKSAAAKHRILYEPDQVICALEVKKLGSFGEPAVKAIKKNFDAITQRHSNIRCAYVTLEERKGYTRIPTQSKIGYPCFTLFLHWTTKGNLQREATGDWTRLLGFLHKTCGTD